MTPREVIDGIERRAALPDGEGDRFSGYGVMGVLFRSGHVLALRRFANSTIGPAYTSVWHRDPSGRWTFYATIAPDLACARYFGRQIQRNVVARIDIQWMDATRFQVLVGAAQQAIQWDVTLRSSLATRLINVVANAIPEAWWQEPAVLRTMGAVGAFCWGPAG